MPPETIHSSTPISDPIEPSNTAGKRIRIKGVSPFAFVSPYFQPSPDRRWTVKAKVLFYLARVFRLYPFPGTLLIRAWIREMQRMVDLGRLVIEDNKLVKVNQR